jgi:hypothetical protein
MLALWMVLSAPGLSYSQGLMSSPSDPPRPTVGSTGGLRIPSPARLPGEKPGSGTRVHLDPMGKPCVAVSAFARAQTLNPNIFDHTIFAQNHCSQAIKLKICYFGSQSCIAVDVPGYGRKEVVLGIYPALKEFRYEYVEQL